MTERPKISVISIIYDVARFLPKAIESMINQTYKELEIILVVGEKEGRNTGDLEICRKYAKEDPRIKLVVTPARGTGDARNKGLDAATGDYIGFVDGDDWAEPDMFEKLYVNLKEHDAKLSVCGKFSEYDDHSEADPDNGIRDMEPKDAFLMILKGTGFFFHCWDKLFEASVFEGLRFPDDRYLEDRYVIDKAIARAGRIVYDTTPLYHYRVRGDSLSRVKDMAEYNTDADTEFCDFACSVAPELRDPADSFLLYDHLTCIQNYLLYFKGKPGNSERMQGRFEEHMEYVKAAGERIKDNPEIKRSLKIKRLMAIYTPGLLAFITRRHVEKIADDKKFQ
ncbi:MAG: glycosyltransferase family 2 protein [Lachnospiraceae bacterium]|nr:glycosyltransferase family 2 protein [Lachnospiraceae bacterium]